MVNSQLRTPRLLNRLTTDPNKLYTLRCTLTPLLENKPPKHRSPTKAPAPEHLVKYYLFCIRKIQTVNTTFNTLSPLLITVTNKIYKTTINQHRVVRMTPSPEHRQITVTGAPY